MSIHFVRVYGTPATQGSKRAFVSKSTGRPIVTESAPEKTRNWRAAVAQAAGEYVEALGEEGPFPVSKRPVRLTLAFYMPRPKAHFSADGTIYPRFLDAPHLVKPDCSKLARAVEDALSGIMWVDDSLVADLLVSKRYASPGIAGVAIEVAFVDGGGS